MHKLLIVTTILFIFGCTQDKGQDNSSSTGVSFLNIKDGDTLTSPFLLKMGVEGMVLEPKGEPKPDHGHHHLLINDGPIDKDLIIVADSTHIHYGAGQSQDSVNLSPGNYKLTLQFADGMHVSYGEEWSKTIQVTIK
jgi:hypothetical protein